MRLINYSYIIFFFFILYETTNLHGTMQHGGSCLIVNKQINGTEIYNKKISDTFLNQNTYTPHLETVQKISNTARLHRKIIQNR